MKKVSKCFAKILEKPYLDYSKENIQELVYKKGLFSRFIIWESVIYGFDMTSDKTRTFLAPIKASSRYEESKGFLDGIIEIFKGQKEGVYALFSDMKPIIVPISFSELVLLAEHDESCTDYVPLSTPMLMQIPNYKCV